LAFSISPRTPQQPADDDEQNKDKEDEEDDGSQQPEAFGQQFDPHLTSRCGLQPTHGCGQDAAQNSQR
jgi:hypothetical protein